jgi:uncharacterized membrane protein (DUF2068 family)
MFQPHSTRIIRLIALVEAAKAGLVLLAGMGVLSLIHRDLHEVAARCIEHLHMNAAKKYPRIFLDAASNVSTAQLWILAALALAYAILRSAEAYGLWYERRWAEWVGVITGGIYVPVELYELWKAANGITIAALLINIAIVAYLVLRIRSAPQRHAPAA